MNETDILQDWLTYHLALGPTASACDLIREFQTPQAVLAQGIDTLRNLGRLRPEQARRLAHPATEKAREIMAICREFDWQIVTPDHPCYPPAFRALADFPLVLFAGGDLSLLQNPSVAAIVGTRRPGDAGLHYAFRLAASFSENGITTVSGCALGVDSASHEGALTGPGSTIGILGNGFGYNYLPVQVFLRRRIRKYGLLLTETLPFEAPASYSFQRRNRLISGLSHSVTVVESGSKGGSLITAGYAFKQGKRVFVPPQDAVRSAGCDALLRKGAAVLERFADAAPLPPGKLYLPPAPPPETTPLPMCLRPSSLSLEEWALINEADPVEAASVYALLPKKGGKRPGATAGKTAEPEQLPDLFARARQNARKRNAEKKGTEPASPKPKADNKPPAEAAPKEPPRTETERPGRDLSALSAEERAVYEALKDEPMLLDAVAGALDMPVQSVMLTVSTLELKGYVRSFPGNIASRA